MRRLVWVAVGAVGGVVVYRRAQVALADARERGVVASAQQVGLSAANALNAARTMASGAAAAVENRTAPTSTPGASAARVLARSKQGA